MAQEKFKYKTVIDLGFVREDIGDSVFYDQYGFRYFIVTKKLDEKINLDWDCNTRMVTMIRSNKSETIVGKMYVETLNELKCIISFFKDE